MTDGKEIFRSKNAVLSVNNELDGVSEKDVNPDRIYSHQDDLSSDQKRVQLMPFFTKFMVNNYGAKWISLSTDSIRNIESNFRTNNTKPPLFLMNTILIKIVGRSKHYQL